jgi:hypothetical protein
METEQRFDVVIKDRRSGEIVATIGMNMTEERADKRIRAGMARINADFYIDIIKSVSLSEKIELTARQALKELDAKEKTL